MKTLDEMIFKVEHDGQPYDIKVLWARSISPQELEFRDYNSIIYKSMMKVMEFERLGRNMFNPKRAQKVQDLEIWPGFYSAVQKMEIGPVICIDTTCKVIR